MVSHNKVSFLPHGTGSQWHKSKGYYYFRQVAIINGKQKS